MPKRYHVEPALIPWTVMFPSYRPPYYVSSKVLNAEAKGADPEVLAKVAMSANPLSGRHSYECNLMFSSGGMPMNPRGRTGMRGRGSLFNWGPNHASDPVIVRCLTGGRYQILCKKRAQEHTQDGEQQHWWALPGQMTEPNVFVGSKLKAFLKVGSRRPRDGPHTRDAALHRTALG